MDEKLEALLAKQAITEVIVRYARAIDRLDEPLLRSVFHPGSQHNHFYEGLSSDPSLPSTPEQPGDFVAFALGLLATYSRTHHQLGNTLITLQGQGRATAETYFTAFHRMRAATDPLAGADAYDNEMDFFVGGRYLDHFELREGEWKIVRRLGMTDWTRLEPAHSHGFGNIAADTIGKRAPDDPVCQL
ncbi:MAG TPA: nuclear transport factor 2 family protein [Kineobactrum sp.]